MVQFREPEHVWCPWQGTFTHIALRWALLCCRVLLRTSRNNYQFKQKSLNRYLFQLKTICAGEKILGLLWFTCTHRIFEKIIRVHCNSSCGTAHGIIPSTQNFVKCCRGSLSPDCTVHGFLMQKALLHRCTNIPHLKTGLWRELYWWHERHCICCTVLKITWTAKIAYILKNVKRPHSAAFDCTMTPLQPQALSLASPFLNVLGRNEVKYLCNCFAQKGKLKLSIGSYMYRVLWMPFSFSWFTLYVTECLPVLCSSNIFNTKPWILHVSFIS